MFEQLTNTPRLLLEQELRRSRGIGFDPPALRTWARPTTNSTTGGACCSVESAQSVANRLEKTCLAGDGRRIDPALEGLPYILARLSGATEAETSSLVEAHRINSPFIISDKKFQDEFLAKSGYESGKPIAWDKIALTLFYFDPNALIHGVFMANLKDGRVRVPRAIAGFIEASNVMEAVSGGVKKTRLTQTARSAPRTTTRMYMATCLISAWNIRRGESRRISIWIFR